MSHTNPTGSIRSGFDYQNFWSLKLCGEWLVDPTKYKWIQFETSPDEDNPSKFYLDDIVCLDSGDSYHLYQVKHRQDPTNQWTWDDLLTAKSSRGTSIINKWARSILPYLDKAQNAFFITNGQGADEITKYVDGETLNIQKLKAEDNALYNRLIIEVGKDEDLTFVFKILHFRFNQENLSGDELENSTRKYFYEELGATESGVNRLYYEIAKECRQRNTRKLDIETLRKWCEFDVPRPLEEQFVIPPDFEFFDDRTHQSILSDLQKPEGGIKVIFGKPGVGKSVYLSELDKELREKDIVCIKHHYHISPEDSSPLERLNAERVVEAVKSQLKSHKEELGSLANKNSREIPIREFIATIATKLNNEGRAMVVIVDGLDHVLRYVDKEELESFLKEICLPQPGVWIVIGMQKIAESHLPQVVFDECPENQWTEIKGLSESAVKNLIKVNSVGLRLPDQSEPLKDLAEKLFSITGGNPLHLRYSLKQLKNLFGKDLVTDYSCGDLLPYSDSIEKYYESLWRQISDNAKTVLLTIASVNFLFTEEQLMECVSFSTSNPADITKGFHEIAHLVSKKHRDKISVYHNSFDVFLKAQKDMKQQRIAIKRNVKQWLQQSSYEYLKWAELKIIEHELGDSDPLLAIDRQWLVDSICYPCNPDQISNQMNLAAKAAYEGGDLGKALKISHLHTHYLNSRDFVDEAPELIWKEAFYYNSSVLDYIDLETLPMALLPDLAEMADSQGNYEALEEIIEVLIGSQSRQEYRQNEVPKIALALLNSLSLDRKHHVKRIYKYIVQFRDMDVTGPLFAAYSRKLLILDQRDKMLALLKLKLTESEKESILTECVEHGLKNNAENIAAYLSGQRTLPLLCVLYQSLKKDVIDLSAVSLPPYDSFVSTIREYASEERKEWQESFHAAFLKGLLYSLAGREKEIEQWIADAPDLWSAKATSCIFAASLRMASGIQKGNISYADFFEPFSGLEILKWPQDRNSLSFQHALSDAIDRIFRDIISIKEYFKDNPAVGIDDYAIAVSEPALFSRDDLIKIVLESEKPLLTKDLYEMLRDQKMAELSKTVNNFPERAKEYADIAKLARLYKNLDLAQPLLKKAADNVLGYGYHKDTYLFSVIDAIGCCAKSAINKGTISNWITRIIPLIDNVGSYTDGDETHYLPNELADLLAEQDPELLRRYYHWTADREELYSAEDLFRSVLKSLSFTTDEEIALATTALDKDSFLQLKNAALGNDGASRALDQIQSYLGRIEYQEEKESGYESIKKPSQDYLVIDREHLLEHVDAIENRWERNEYLVGWFEYWVSRISKENILQTFAKIAEKFGRHTISGGVLDLLYPLAYESDSQAAFNILCEAQVEDHGWNRYWTEKGKAESRWRFIKEKYPKRYLEFFQRTTNYHIPLDRGVEFFVLLGDLTLAEAITEASIQFVESLMADTTLPVPEWFKENEEISVLDILMQRLLWPSPLVRERSAVALADLLGSSEKKSDILNRLLLWINQQQMETTVAIGLLPIIKAFYTVNNLSDLDYIEIKDIAGSVLLNSQVVERLFDEIALLMGTSKPGLPVFKEIEPVPNAYVTNTFFSKHVKTLLAPIYTDRARNIERASLKQFTKQWSFTADRIIQDSGLVLDSNQMSYYGRHEHDEFLLGFSSKVSEAYRSAFIRVVQDYYRNGDIHEEFYLEYVYATLPIELSRWKLIPARSPEWWPKLASVGTGSTEQKDVIMPIAFECPVEKLIREQNGEFLIAAEGAIQPAAGWAQVDPSCSFSLISFGYRIVGPKLPTAEETAEKVSLPALVAIPSMPKRPFNFLEEKKNCVPMNCDPIQIEDMIIYPFIVKERDLCIALWQCFRDYHTGFNLNPKVKPGLEVRLNKHGWELQNERGLSIIIFTDWLEGLKERYNFEMPLPHGQYLIANADFINERVKENNLRLGYVLRTTYRSRQYSYDKVEKYEQAKLINVSSIIT